MSLRQTRRGIGGRGKARDEEWTDSITVAGLTIKCANHRKESRGLHYNIVYPQRDDRRWKKDTVIRRQIVG